MMSLKIGFSRKFGFFGVKSVQKKHSNDTIPTTEKVQEKQDGQMA